MINATHPASWMWAIRSTASLLWCRATSTDSAYEVVIPQEVFPHTEVQLNTSVAECVEACRFFEAGGILLLHAAQDISEEYVTAYLTEREQLLSACLKCEVRCWSALVTSSFIAEPARAALTERLGLPPASIFFGDFGWILGQRLIWGLDASGDTGSPLLELTLPQDEQEIPAFRWLGSREPARWRPADNWKLSASKGFTLASKIPGCRWRPSFPGGRFHALRKQIDAGRKPRRRGVLLDQAVIDRFEGDQRRFPEEDYAHSNLLWKNGEMGELSRPKKRRSCMRNHVVWRCFGMVHQAPTGRL